MAARSTFYNSYRLISFFDFAISEFCSFQQLRRMMHFCIISQLAGCRCNNLSAFLKPFASFVDSTLCTYKQLLSVCDILSQICHTFHRSCFCLNECTESQHQQSHDEQDDRLFHLHSPFIGRHEMTDSYLFIGGHLLFLFSPIQ